jgi:geranylgeranyl diphosphate synthase type II
MMIYVYQYLLRLASDAPLVEILNVFNRAAIEVCEGQQFDMEFENQEMVTIEAYLHMIKLKTAVLLGAALKIGALIGGGATEDAEHLYEFGSNIGLAFQLQDDILDTFGDPEKFGKKVGGDIAQNKKTFLFLKALELANAPQRKSLQLLYASQSRDEKEKIGQVTELFRQLRVREIAEREKEKFLGQAFFHLDAVKVPRERKASLIHLANHLMGRES